jgi:hypothetical protein
MYQAKSKNVTFSLPPELIEKFKQYAEQDIIPSVNGAVREALEQYAVRMDQELLARSMRQAANDPAFMNDLNSCLQDFAAVDFPISSRSDLSNPID